MRSLLDIFAISLHWSSDCNMACKYCYIDKNKQCMEAYNQKIRIALQDGSYVQNIKRIFAETANQIENISLWGAEPTINSKYFERTIIPLLDFFPNVTSIMFSTNALRGWNCIYRDFLVPVMKYTEEHKRPIRFELQFSLDGPAYINDSSRHLGATVNTIQTIYDLSKQLAKDNLEYLNVDIHTKITLDVSYMRDMVNGGLKRVEDYFIFFNDCQNYIDSVIKDSRNINVDMATSPTLVDPGYHTQEDGRILAKWIGLLSKVDKKRIPHYKDKLLLVQLYGRLASIYNNPLLVDNILSAEREAFSCSSGKNNITVDHEGNLFSCNRLCRNMAMGTEAINKSSMRSNTNIHCSEQEWMKKVYAQNAFHEDMFSRKYIADGIMIALAKCGQIDAKYAEPDNDDDRMLAFQMLFGLYCHIGAEEDYTGNPSIPPTSYFKYLCNGAIDEYMKYLALEMERGVIPKWQN